MLKVLLNKDEYVDPQPSLLQEKSNGSEMADELRESESSVTPTANYFGISDLFSYANNSDEYDEDENYESLRDDCMLDFTYATVSCGLIKSDVEENTYTQTTRFPHDIIFSINESKIFEIGAVSLSAAMAASLAMLPEGFNVAMALLLSAPLLVCACGILAKHRKRKT